MWNISTKDRSIWWNDLKCSQRESNFSWVRSYIYAYGLGCPTGSVKVCTPRPLEFRCTSGSVIAIVSASFGRSDRYACGVDDPTVCDPPGFDVLDELLNRCFQKERCTLNLHPQFVYHEDPCPDVHKYLNLTYECMKSNYALHLCCNYALHLC